MKFFKCLIVSVFVLLPGTAIAEESFTGSDSISYWFVRSQADRNKLSLIFTQEAQKINFLPKKLSAKKIKQISLDVEKCITNQGEKLLDKNEFPIIAAVSSVCLLQQKNKYK